MSEQIATELPFRGSLSRPGASSVTEPEPASPATPRATHSASLIQSVSRDHVPTEASGPAGKASADELFTVFNYHHTDFLNFAVT